MLRRIFTFIIAIVLIGAVAGVVYFNAQPTTLRLTPQHQYDLRLGHVIIGAFFFGALAVFLLSLVREGRWALRQWRVEREKRMAQRNVGYRTEARALALAGQHARARALLSKAGKSGEPNVLDVVDYAETYMAERNPAEARKVLEKGIHDFGNDPLLLHALARACRQLGAHAAAISSLERAVASYTSSLPLHLLLRDVLVETRAWRRASEVQQRIVELVPADQREKERLLDLRLKAALQLEPDKIEPALRAIQGMDPDYAPALVARAKVLRQRDDRRGAAKLLEKSARRRPQPAVLDALEATLGPDSNGHLVKLYSKLLASEASDELRLRLARVQVAAGNLDEAERLLRQVDESAAPARVHALWGDLYRARSRPELAEEFYRKALAASAQAYG